MLTKFPILFTAQFQSNNRNPTRICMLLWMHMQTDVTGAHRARISPLICLVTSGEIWQHRRIPLHTQAQHVSERTNEPLRPRNAGNTGRPSWRLGDGVHDDAQISKRDFSLGRDERRVISTGAFSDAPDSREKVANLPRERWDSLARTRRRSLLSWSGGKPDDRFSWYSSRLLELREKIQIIRGNLRHVVNKKTADERTNWLAN